MVLAHIAQGLNPGLCGLINYLVVVPPLIHPLGLNHFQMSFCAFFAGAFKVGNFHYPIQQFGEADSVYFAFIKIIAKTLIEFHGNIFVIGPVYRGFKHVLFVNSGWFIVYG